MQDYIQDIKNAARNNLDKRFPNSSLEHARYLVAEIINHSDKKVYSLSSNFHQDFYKSIKKEIVNFLKKPDSEFNLITPNDENDLVAELKGKYSNFKVKQVEKNKLPKNSATDKYINYIVNDKNAFRYEYNEEDIDVGIVEAIANFNSPKEADILINNFNSICKD